MNSRQMGVALVVLSAVVFSLAGIFTKGVEAAAWDILFWRGVSAAAFTFAYLVLRREFREELQAIDRPTLVIIVMFAAGSAAFIPAFKLSSVANVALIYGAAPLVAAALAWMFLRERPATLVVLASLAAFAGVLLIFSGSAGAIALRGDALALFMTLMMAGGMVVYRAFPNTKAAMPAALSAVVLLPFAFVLGNPLEVAVQEIPILVLFGLVFAVASVCLAEGARRLPPAETALLSILEMPLAPLLAMLILAEVPGGATIAGGAVILVAVLASQSPGWRWQRS